MIRINRPAEVPAVLSTRGEAQRTKLERDHDRDPARYETGERTFSFNAKIYGHPSVKEALVAAQHGKCCFCESKAGMDGDVEHYRPKGGYCQGRGEPMLGPGYYWLAYEWSNLLLCCAICNQRFKRNLFPLADPAARARTHHDDLSREDPLFINPADRDPEEHVAFRREIPYAIDDNPYGRATITSLGLDREVLNEKRREYLEALRLMYDFVRKEDQAPPEFRENVREMKAFLARATADRAEFASMARCAARVDFYLDH